MTTSEPLSGEPSTQIESITSSAGEAPNSFVAEGNGAPHANGAHKVASAAAKAVSRPAKAVGEGAEKPVREPKLDKVELIKEASQQLRTPSPSNSLTRRRQDSAARAKHCSSSMGFTSRRTETPARIALKVKGEARSLTTS